MKKGNGKSSKVKSCASYKGAGKVKRIKKKLKKSGKY